MNIKILKTDYHRNGVGGEPFKAIIFQHSEDDDDTPKTMVAIRFADDKKKGGFSAPRCAVFDLALLYEGVIEFGQNSWRGDHFATHLDKALEGVGA
jgi:hypothetical protein